jgi:type II secretory pathway component PulF
MLDAGMGLLPSLEILASQHESDEAWETVKVEIVSRVESGYSFSKALSGHPEYFSPSQLVAIRSAERSGSMASVLAKLDEKLSDEQTTKGRLKKALTYPVFLTLLSLGGTFLLFKYVLPGIIEGTATGQSDFLPTRVLMLGVTFVNSWFGLSVIIGGGLLAVAALRRAEVRESLYMIAWRLPFIGPLLINSASLDSATSLKLLVSSGTPVANAVEFSLAGSDSPALREAAPKITRRIMQGDSVTQAFINERSLFSHILIDMLALIDETSEYEKSLEAAIAYLKFDVEQRVEQLLQVIEPVVLLGVSSMIAFVAISVVVPIMQLSASLG